MLFLEIYIVCGILSGIITYFMGWVLYKNGYITKEEHEAVPSVALVMMALGVFSFTYIVLLFISDVASDYEE